MEKEMVRAVLKCPESISVFKVKIGTNLLIQLLTNQGKSIEMRP